MNDQWHSHALCLGCWQEVEPGREPVRMKEDSSEIEICCRCGMATKSGIYYRGSVNDLGGGEGDERKGTGRYCTRRATIPTVGQLVEHYVWNLVDMRFHYNNCWLDHQECAIKYFWFHLYCMMDDVLLDPGDVGYEPPVIKTTVISEGG